MQDRTELIRPSQVCKQLGISSTTLYRLVKSQKLKAPVKISSRCTAFRVQDIESYIQESMEVSNDSH